jgi:type VII secretion-associated serine protease mycosin
MKRFAAAVAAVALVASAIVVVDLASAQSARADYIRDGEYWLDQYGIREAWKTTQGKGVTIAVIDTGVDGTHADLTGAVIGGTDFSGSGSSNGQKPVGSTESEHGTMVASLAAGRGSAPGVGVIGTAPQASILSISIGFGSSADNSDTQVAKAVTWAVDHGARVINMSLTRNTLSWPESWDKAFLYAMNHNAVIVAAAGNRGSGTSEVGAPATMPGVLTVAGVDRNKHASLDASAQGITIGVSAPSEQLLGAVPGGGTVQWNGTSGATPIVAGVVALVMAAHPELDAANVINRIVQTATPAGAPGVDPIYGHGLLNAAAAVKGTVKSVTANPMGDLAEWIRINRRASPTGAPATMPSTTSTPIDPRNSNIAASPPSPFGVLYPTPLELRNVGIPVGVLTIFGLAFIALLVAAIRRFRRSRGRL